MTTLVPLNRKNWESFLDIEVHPEQIRFVPSILYSLAQAKFEALIPLGIWDNEKNQAVGFAMYGEFQGMFWVNRLIIDKRFQQKGIGTQILKDLLLSLQNQKPAYEIRTSYAKENTAARRLFESVGFVPINDALPDEIVAVYLPKNQK